LKKIEEVYGNKVRFVWKNLPLSFHQNAAPAALAAAAAHQQGKFWEFHDRLFANQSLLNAANYLKYARELGLDLDRFEKDTKSPSSAAGKQIETDKAEAEALGITGTPAFFVNGRYLSGAKPFEDFAKVIDAELARLKSPLPKPGS
jgi:protein-disulfide isomerase